MKQTILKKTTLLLVLSILNQLKAQDRIITIKSDTLLAKITSIDKQKVVYYLESDIDKKTVEMPLINLHKVIWRSGMVYVINEELEAKTSNTISEKPIPVNKEVENSNVPTVVSNAYTITEVPKLRVNWWVLWRTYTVNGKMVSPDEVEKVLYKYDLDTHAKFSNAAGIKRKGRKMSRIALIPFFVAIPVYAVFPIAGLVLQVGGIVTGIVGNIITINGKGLMRKSVLAYENKRTNNNLKPRFAPNN